MSPRQIFKSNMLFPQIRESGATAPPAASLDIGFRGYRELSNRDEMSHSSALFDLGAGIPCSRAKNSLLARAGNFAARPSNPRPFRCSFSPKETEFPAVSLLRREFPARDPPTPPPRAAPPPPTRPTRSG